MAHTDDGNFLDWNNNHELAWRRETFDLIDYNSETITLFEITFGYLPHGLQIGKLGSTFENTFRLCSFTKDHSQATFASFTAKYDQWISNNDNTESN